MMSERNRLEADSLRARLEQQKTEISVAERQQALWQQQMDDTVIRAPFAGVVGLRYVSEGALVNAATRVATL